MGIQELDTESTGPFTSHLEGKSRCGSQIEKDKRRRRLELAWRNDHGGTSTTIVGSGIDAAFCEWGIFEKVFATSILPFVLAQFRAAKEVESPTAGSRFELVSTSS